MNIGIVLIGPPYGGRESAVYMIQDSLSRHGHNVTLITNDEFLSWENPIRANHISLGKLFDMNHILSEIFGNNKYPNFMKNLKFKSLLLDIYFAKKKDNIYKEIFRNNIDILNFHEQGSLRLHKFHPGEINIPSVYTYHGDSYDWNKIGKMYMGYHKKGLFDNKKKVDSMKYTTSVCQYHKETLLKQGHPDNIKVIYNGIDISDISKIGNKPKRKSDDFVVLFPGGSDPNKGGDVVIKAINILKDKIPNLKLRITREINDGSFIHSLVKKYDLDNIIKFIGQLPRNKNLEEMSNADIIVQPSKIEAFSLIYLESMALGKPIVATNCGGVPELVKHGRNGLTCSSERNPVEVASMLYFLYKNPKLRNEMGKNNLNDINYFGWDRITADYLSIFSSIIKK